MASEKGGWTATGRREEEEEGSGGGFGTAGTRSGDSVNGAASAAAAVAGGRFDVSIAKTAGDLATPVDNTVAGFDNDAAADDDLVIGVAGGGLASAVGDLAIVEPAGKLEMAELADGLETVVLCGSS